MCILVLPVSRGVSMTTDMCVIMKRVDVEKNVGCANLSEYIRFSSGSLLNCI